MVTHRAESPVSNECTAAHAECTCQETAAAFTFSSPCAASSVLYDLPYASAGSVHFFAFLQNQTSREAKVTMVMQLLHAMQACDIWG